MRKVLKFQFETDGTRVLRVGQFSKVVHFARQRDAVMVWVEHLVDAVTDRVLTLQYFGTGHEIHDTDMRHIMSTIDGPFVWHLYGKTEKA